MTNPLHVHVRIRPLAAIFGLAVAFPAALEAGPQQDARQAAYSAVSPAPAPGAPALRPSFGPLHPALELERIEDALDGRDAADLAGLRRAAHLSIMLALAAGDAGDDAERLAWVRRSEAYARRALDAEPSSLDARYLVAAAMGLRAVHEPVRERVRMAGVIREHAEAILLADPAHAGALHVVGQLNAAGMRLNPLVRFIARRTLGGDALRDASWARAEAAFRGAINGEPENPAHRYELARVLLDTGRAEEARAELEAILAAPGEGLLVEHYRRRAAEALAIRR